MCGVSRMERMTLVLPVIVIFFTGMTLSDAQIQGSTIDVLRRLNSEKLPSECDSVVCIPKCCPLGYSVENKTCEPMGYTFEPGYSVENKTCEPMGYTFEPVGTEKFSKSNISYVYVIGFPCAGHRFPLYAEEYELRPNASLFDKMRGDLENPENYCLTETSNEILALFCVTENITTPTMAQTPVHVFIYPIGLLVSVSFLLLTMFVYLAIPDLRDLHGKALVCHLGCQVAAYFFLAMVQLVGEGFGETSCKVVAFIIQFSFSGTFFWLHVMCFDVLWCVLVATGMQWRYPGAKKWVFRGKRWMTGLDDLDVEEDRRKKREDKKFEHRMFGIYSVYAWFFSLLPIILVLANNLGPTIPDTYLEYNMVSKNCHFMANLESMHYFYPPIGAIMITSILMFSVILYKALNFTWNATGCHRVPKQKARMCFMLFVLMALNWLTDITQWAYNGARITWSVLNIFNILQGLVTFFIFVLEDRVKYLIITKLWPRLRSIQAKLPCRRDIERAPEHDAPGENINMLNGP